MVRLCDVFYMYFFIELLFLITQMFISMKNMKVINALQMALCSGILDHSAYYIKK